MAESRKFGPRIFGDKTSGGLPGDNEHCAQCEAMLTDVIDGTLSVEQQDFFDLHVTSCGPCAQMVADARRGVAWLEMLRTPAPEPPVDLLERILAQTAWTPASVEVGQVIPLAMQSVTPGHSGEHAMVPGYVTGGPAAVYDNVLPFPRRAVSAFRRSGFGQIVLQPRLAMTAAMAFFSVALTLNITGFHPTSLRASDLQPSSLERNFSDAKARGVRYYENLRVVYELESRVHDLQSAQDTDPTAGSQVGTPNSAQPGNQNPAGQPAPANEKAAPSKGGPAGDQPGAKQPDRSKPGTSPGTSRSEELNRARRFFVAEVIGPASDHKRKHASLERKLV